MGTCPLHRCPASTGSEPPRFTKDEFEGFLECHAHGFLWLRCGECGAHDKLLAFSCKSSVPVRQWVMSLPMSLRLLMAA